MKKIAISIGDLNGIGIQLALENHETIKKIIEPLYCIDKKMLQQASELLDIPIPSDFKTVKKIAKKFSIEPAKVTKESGVYSFASFLKAVELSKMQEVDGIMTLPIHKKAWELAGVNFKGHTDALRELFFAPAIMMLGSPKMYVALYTEHIPLNQVHEEVKNVKKLSEFLIDFYENIKDTLKEDETIGLLGLNPHAGDDGVLGDEEIQINEARGIAHKALGKEAYTSPLVPDVAFTPNARKNHRYFVAMYHDQGLAPLKALYFDEGINISLNLPIIRTSVDHGTAFDIAYKNVELNNLSYLNALNYFVTT
ncbi:MAG: 4-hydroxythreonine-4-phosphate dehydrogenase (EC [uncultured Sulfurovum sp.]|uniref:4-hydroxythreonine-4-phosphate dehydrogenase n=1 Tax=uncultured Sulfurovum sp. TaxID=269237 RepID=A0A6S6SXD9_9BACT|nr:MAG: 4-hydroxythreonine-4-phosphate dehydrogenase (EC [uncultured Sulfurovum sp.]